MSKRGRDVSSDFTFNKSIHWTGYCKFEETFAEEITNDLIDLLNNDNATGVDDLRIFTESLTETLNGLFPELNVCDITIRNANVEPCCEHMPTMMLATLPDIEFPLAVMVALHNDTCVNVWTGSIRKGWLDPVILKETRPMEITTVTLKKGDVLVYRGDLIHSITNVKEHVHCFLDSMYVPRGMGVFKLKHHLILDALCLRLGE